MPSWSIWPLGYKVRLIHFTDLVLLSGGMTIPVSLEPTEPWSQPPRSVTLKKSCVNCGLFCEGLSISKVARES